MGRIYKGGTEYIGQVSQGSSGTQVAAGPPIQTLQTASVTNYSYVTTTAAVNAGKAHLSANAEFTDVELTIQAKAADDTQLGYIAHVGAELLIVQTGQAVSATQRWVQATVSGVSLANGKYTITFREGSITKGQNPSFNDVGVDVKLLRGLYPTWNDIEFDPSAASNTHTLASTDWVRKNSGHMTYVGWLNVPNLGQRTSFDFDIPTYAQEFCVCFDKVLVGSSDGTNLTYEGERDVFIQVNGSTSGYHTFSIGGGSSYYSDVEPGVSGFVIQRKIADNASAKLVGEYFLAERAGIIFGNGNIGGTARDDRWEQVSSCTGMKAGISQVSSIKVIPATVTGQNQVYFIGGACNVGYR